MQNNNEKAVKKYTYLDISNLRLSFPVLKLLLFTFNVCPLCLPSHGAMLHTQSRKYICTTLFCSFSHSIFYSEFCKWGIPNNLWHWLIRSVFVKYQEVRYTPLRAGWGCIYVPWSSYLYPSVWALKNTA